MKEAKWRYYNTIDQLSNIFWTAGKLSRFSLLQEWQRDLFPKGHKTKFVQVVGTSGKGSTTRFLEAGFGLFGRSGSLTSPHLFDYRERIRVDGEAVSGTDMVWAWEEKILPLCVRMAMKGENMIPTFSEVFLLMALVLFEKYKVRWAVLEASVGGRYDITTALPISAAVLTNIGNDHITLLGERSWQRALDKGGIIRGGVPFFTGEIQPEHLEIFREFSVAANNLFFTISDRDVRVISETADAFPHSSVSPLYQRKNLALAFFVLQHFFPKISKENFVNVCARQKIEGRFSVSDALIFDVAHNSDKLTAFVRNLQKEYPGKKHVFVFGISGDRDAIEHARIIAPVAKQVFLTSGFHKSQTRKDLLNIQNFFKKKNIVCKIFDTPGDAFAVAESVCKKTDRIILTGSTYMIDQILNRDPYLRFLNTQYGWRTPEDRNVQ